MKASHPTPDSVTLFYDAGTNAAAVVTEKAGKFSSKEKRFINPHDALDWAIAIGAKFVYVPAPAAAKN